MIRRTREQRQSLFKIWIRHNQAMTYRSFRKTVHGTVGMEFVIAVPWCGRWLAIEPDGYTPS